MTWQSPGEHPDAGADVLCIAAEVKERRWPRPLDAPDLDPCAIGGKSQRRGAWRHRFAHWKVDLRPLREEHQQAKRRIQACGNEQEQERLAHVLRLQLPSCSSTVASISTAMLEGSDCMPTAERAPRPASPKASTIRSEKPFTTRGWSLKSSVACTIPRIRTKRLTRDSSPMAALIVASMHSPTRSAERTPCSSVTPAPSLP